MRKISALILFVLLALLVSGCNNPDKSELSSETVNITQSSETEPVTTESETNEATKTDETVKQTTAKTAAKADTTSSKELSENPPVSKKSETSATTQTTTDNNPKQSEVSNNNEAKEIKLSFAEYVSGNEPLPYVKDKPIYSILYSGTRCQVNDTLVFKVSCSPADSIKTVKIENSDNLSCSLSGNTLTVKVKSKGQYDTGSVTVYSNKASDSIRLSIDAPGNPYNDINNLLCEYIRYKGLVNTTVENGYTASNPSLSITKFDGAPAWDDQIQKTESNWVSKCFWLIDQYAAKGFHKVNFIITGTSAGFSACA